jgi:hypothetical protein
MTEKLLQYIWQFQYFNRDSLTTIPGDVVEIIHPGILNVNQGPDFLNARIKIGNTVFAGSVELHLKTSDWHKHGHHKDKNYNNVILHVVLENDQQSELPVLELQHRISQLMLNKYEQLMNNSSFIPCSNAIGQLKDITWASWKERLLAERLLRKSQKVFDLLQQTNYHWEETFWWMLARSFGGKLNADAFEEVAKTIPVNLLAKHKLQIHQLEGLLLGQAGFLHEKHEEDYPKLLWREYNFLKKKYNLQQVHTPMHFLRMRPANFPTVRLAQLAMIIQKSSHMLAKILKANDVDEVKNWLSVTANDYWHYHYRFDEESSFSPKKTGSDFIDVIIINTIIPMVFAYGVYHKDESSKEKAIKWLEKIKGEKNYIIKGFGNIGVKSITAFDSQALLELKNEYCSNKRCLTCAVGNYLLKC